MRKIYVFLIISILSIGIFTNTFSATSTEKKLSTTKKITFDKNQIDEIIKKINTNIDLEVKKAENQKDVLTQGNFKAEYIRPKNYKTDKDKIIITISGKKYEIPGIYGEKERQIYLKKIKKGGCKDKDGKLTVPFSLQCSTGLVDFSHFDSFSPSGYYVLISIGGWDYFGKKLIDTKTGKIIIDSLTGLTFHSWTKDKKRFIYGTMGGYASGPGLYITKSGKFPKVDEISKNDIVGGYLDEKYIYTIEDYSIGEGTENKYFKIYDLKTLKEIFSKNISGEVLDNNSNVKNLDYKIEEQNGEKILYLLKDGKKIKIDSSAEGGIIDSVSFIENKMIYEWESTGGSIMKIFDTNSMKELGKMRFGELTRDKKFIYSCIDSGYMPGSVEIFNLSNFKYIDLLKKLNIKEGDIDVGFCNYEEKNNYIRFKLSKELLKDKERDKIPYYIYKFETEELIKE